MGRAGLSDDEAAQRLRRDGPNRLPQLRRRTLPVIALAVFTQPMFLLLLATSAVYGLIGSLSDALVLLVSVAVVATISIVQEHRTERVLESRKELSSPRSRVLRAGRVLRIASQDLVRGDRLLIHEGDRLACDATLVEAHSLQLDESMLTGESVPVAKAALDGAQATATDAHRVHAGTLVVQGDGVAIVHATGAHTALGRIGGSLAQIEPRPSRVQAELKQVVARIALFATLICVAAAVLYAARQGSWVEGLLVGLTLAMAIIPEEFAVVWTVLMALGAWRLAQRGVLTRQAQAIEALGTTTVLCVDKTGTLTRNQMELLALATPQAQVALTGGAVADRRFAELLDSAALASVANGLEPMDRAIFRLRDRGDTTVATGADPLELAQRESVAPGHPYLANTWRRRDGGGGLLAVKGAPDAVLGLCAVEPEAAAQVAAQADRLAQQGLRVLGVARADWLTAPAPSAGSPPLRWLGLIGFLDPLRDDVPQAIEQCRQAGIRVVMITGDAAQTARTIARLAGLDAGGDAAAVVTGPELAAMSDAALDDAVRTAAVYARVTPAQKLRIVRALQRAGAVVAMTGDGVNDAAALRAADIGVAMGERGTDVAREAAALVLQTDSFAALVAAVRMGRRIFGNLKHSVAYLLAVHVPIIGVSLMPVLFGGPVLLLPLHVVFLELIIDPACSLVFEAEPEPGDCMTQPPRPARVRLIASATVGQALAVGGLGLLGVAAIQLAGRALGLPAPWLRLGALASVIVANLAMLSWFRAGAAGALVARPINRTFLWLLIGICAASAAVLLIGPLSAAFGLPDDARLRAATLVLALVAGWAGWRLRAPAAPAPQASAV
ncbi:MAG: HAD-IC family P-type ATPase [Burkholderiales bacterium]|nr:HAD-IC family P-type ATPase [Burkholderiales bacterium]